MSGHCIHIFGASGSGTSTLGRALAGAIASQHFDTDDFFWYPTDPPFQKKRPIAERRALMQAVFLPRRDWVLSGSLESWSEGIANRFTLAVFLCMESSERLARLRAREEKRMALARDGDVHHRQNVEAFLEWAAGYDDGLQAGRCRCAHEAWVEELDCPVIRLDAARPVHALVGEIRRALDPARQLA